jgi:hypothetical protein
MEQWCGDRRVQDVACPEAGAFQRSDQAPQLALRDQSSRELARQIDAVAEQGRRNSGLALDDGVGVSHRNSWVAAFRLASLAQ